MAIRSTGAIWGDGRSRKRNVIRKDAGGLVGTALARSNIAKGNSNSNNSNLNSNINNSAITNARIRRTGPPNHRLPAAPAKAVAVAIAGSQRPPQNRKPRTLAARKRPPTSEIETELASCLQNLALDHRSRTHTRSRSRSSGSNNAPVVPHQPSSRTAATVVQSSNRRSDTVVSFGRKEHPNHPTSRTVPTRVRAHLVAWTETVFASIGPGRKERVYQLGLRDLLLRQGLDVAVEVSLKFQRMVVGDCECECDCDCECEEPTPSHQARTRTRTTATAIATAVDTVSVSKRADVIVSAQGQSERVLIECKAKPRLTRDDFRQVMWYQHHFGIQDCYLVNFCGRTKEEVQVHKLREG